MRGPVLRGGHRDWTRIGLWLVGATLAYDVVEAVIALASGAAAESIALIGFGLDSGIEVAAASRPGEPRGHRPGRGVARGHAPRLVGKASRGP